MPDPRPPRRAVFYPRPGRRAAIVLVAALLVMLAVCAAIACQP